MDSAKEEIKCNFNNIKKSYEPVWKIIDEMQDHRLHRPLRATSYYLNPHLHYEPSFRHDDLELKKKQIRKTIALPFDEVLYDDEWITEEGYDYEVEPPQENLVLLEPNVDDAQSEEDLDGGGDDDDDDLGHFVIRGLSMDI
ncbi:hypothetical protein HKD37_04G010856 [Glycine soja]